MSRDDLKWASLTIQLDRMPFFCIRTSIRIARVLVALIFQCCVLINVVRAESREDVLPFLLSVQNDILTEPIYVTAYPISSNAFQFDVTNIVDGYYLLKFDPAFIDGLPDTCVAYTNIFLVSGENNVNISIPTNVVEIVVEGDPSCVPAYRPLSPGMAVVRVEKHRNDDHIDPIFQQWVPLYHKSGLWKGNLYCTDWGRYRFTFVEEGIKSSKIRDSFSLNNVVITNSMKIIQVPVQRSSEGYSGGNPREEVEKMSRQDKPVEEGREEN